MWPFALFWPVLELPHTAPVCVVMAVPTGIVWSSVTLSGVPFPCGVWQPKHPSGDGFVMTSLVSGVGVTGGVAVALLGLPIRAFGSQANLIELYLTAAVPSS